MDLLAGVSLLQVATDDASSMARKTVAMAGQMARQLGADVFHDGHFAARSDFVGRAKHSWSASVHSWIDDRAEGILLVAEGASDYPLPESCSAVVYKADVDASEATLFADSGLAYLLGDPERAPLVPEGDYGAGTSAYGLLAALCALAAKLRRFGVSDVARIRGAEVLAWVNWKAAIAASLGTDMKRQGEKAEWPVVPCADGYIALVYQERDWSALMEMVGDERLKGTTYEDVDGAGGGRTESLRIVRDWMLSRSKRELLDLFTENQIPATPVMTTADLLNDPLLTHREAFVNALRPDGTPCKSPRLPHRVVATSGHVPAKQKAHEQRLPLSGFRVLDLGIITAGAGVSALLADLGAEVIKIESDTYPDPFRSWAGAAVSPFFRGNNRNKYAISINLKTDEGKQQFRELARSADVVVENYRRGVLDRLGFSYEVLRALNPAIILASVSGQGLSGPGTSASSFGSTLEGSSGFAAKIRDEEGRPYITGLNVNYPDQTVVLYATAVITSALVSERRGMHLDVSQRDVAIYLSGEDIESVSSGQACTNLYNGRAFRTRDGDWVVFDDSKLSSEDCPENISDWAGSTSTSALIASLKVSGVGAAVVKSSVGMLRAFEDADSPIFVRSPNGDLVKGFPFQFDRSPLRIERDSPDVGQHTADYV